MHLKSTSLVWISLRWAYCRSCHQRTVPLHKLHAVSLLRLDILCWKRWSSSQAQHVAGQWWETWETVMLSAIAKCRPFKSTCCAVGVKNSHFTQLLIFRVISSGVSVAVVRAFSFRHRNCQLYGQINRRNVISLFALQASVASRWRWIYSTAPPTHSFTPGLKPSFSANPSHCSPSFLLLKYSLHGFSGLFTVISKHICFLLLVFLFLHFLVVGSVR